MSSVGKVSNIAERLCYSSKFKCGTMSGRSDVRNGNILSANVYQRICGELKSYYNNLGFRTTIQDDCWNFSSLLFNPDT
jgi:hypothetical protein